MRGTKKGMRGVRVSKLREYRQIKLLLLSPFWDAVLVSSDKRIQNSPLTLLSIIIIFIKHQINI
jgi:hypothetical protein